MDITILTCEKCGHKAIPPKYACPKCLAGTLEEKKDSGRGIIYSFTKIHVAPGKYSVDIPYHIILVELENGLRVTARLENEEAVVIGQKVELIRVEDSVYWFQTVDE